MALAAAFTVVLAGLAGAAGFVVLARRRGAASAPAPPAAPAVPRESVFTQVKNLHPVPLGGSTARLCCLTHHVIYSRGIIPTLLECVLQQVGRETAEQFASAAAALSGDAPRVRSFRPAASVQSVTYWLFVRMFATSGTAIELRLERMKQTELCGTRCLCDFEGEEGEEAQAPSWAVAHQRLLCHQQHSDVFHRRQ